MTANHQRSRLGRLTKHSIGALITIVCLVVFFRQINLGDVVSALSSFDWKYLILGLASLAIGYAFRILRWSIMLKATGSKADFAACSSPFLGSITLNNVLPFRIGDVVRALVFPASMGISKTTATSSLIIERLIDLITLLACFAIGIFAIRQIEIPSELKTLALTLAGIGCVILLVGFFFSDVLGEFFFKLANRSEPTQNSGKVYYVLGGLLHSFNAMSRPKTLLTMLCVSVVVWVGEAGLFYFILRGTGIDGSPIQALLVMSVATLSTLLPSSPGYVGTFHMAAFTAISLIGGTVIQAGSYAVIVHLALWLPTTLAGALAIWIYPELFKAAKFKISEV